MTILHRIRHFLADNQIMLVLAALILGVVFPSAFRIFSSYTTIMLMVIFFTSSLRLEFGELAGYVKDWKMLLIANAIMLFFMPFAMWLPTWAFAPDWSLAFLIVGVVPTGLTIALIADLFGGRPSLAMLISATTSLLSPITIPLVLSVLVGKSVAIPVLSLFGSLFLTIVVPFIGAALMKAKFRPFVQKHDLLWRETSLFLFALVVAGVVADTVSDKALPLGWNELGIVAVMTIFMGGIAWFAYAITNWRTASERITIALCMVYMNNTLALYIGDKYFQDQNVVPKLLVILTAVNALLPPIKWAAARAIKQPKQRTPRVAQPVI
jgi:BASS family bile acid:Na+ symporter